MIPTRSPVARPRRRVVAILEGILAACGLLAFVIGVPLVLRVVAPIGWPQTWATPDQIRSVLERPDDGTLFIGTLTLVCWAGWAWLTLSVLIEIVSAIARTPVPSIPLLGMSRTMAKTLVVAAGVLLTSTAPLVTTSTAHATTAIELVLPEQPAVLTGNAAFTGAPRASRAAEVAQRFGAPPPTSTTVVDRHPVITVARGDSLWGLAERHLGAGSRFTEIRDLNLHRPQADGRALTGENWLYPGWHLLLPFDASALPAASTGATSVAATDPSQSAVHEVVPGDTLWNLAETRLGNGARYPEIYDLNAGTLQPGGGALTDPDVIRPGWRLAIPTAASTSPSPSPTPERAADAGGQDPLPLVEHEAPAPALPDASAQGSSSLGSRADAQDGGGGANAAADPTVRDVERGGEDAQDTSSARTLVLGLTALAAAGVLGELARRRRRQHRLRRAGERIALPEQGSEAAITERALRQSVEPMTLGLLKRGLQLLGPTCRAAGRGLPRIGVILVGEETIDLVLTEDDEAPVEPFASVNGRTWRATHDSFNSCENDSDLGGFPDPYPALVNLGITSEASVLLNLEAAGVLSVNGPPSAVAATMRALACELATSALTANAVLVLGPEFADLAEVSTSTIVGSVKSSEDLDRRSGVLAAADRDILSHAHATDALHARSMLTAGETWNPTIFFGGGQESTAEPWAGSALVTTGRNAKWRLDLGDDRTGRLEPIGLSVEVQHLSDEVYRDLLELLRNAGQETTRDESDEVTSVESDFVEILAAVPGPTVPISLDPPDAGSRAEPGDAQSVLPESGLAGQSPRVLLLGKVAVTGVAHVTPDRERRNIELVAFLSCNPGASADQVDEVLGHGKRIDHRNRNARISRARTWLGSASDGRPHLMKIENRDDYRLDPAVRSDWNDFLALANSGLARGTDGASDLRAALALVRGRPFLGVPRGTYEWADALTHEMIDTITDVAHALALVSIDARDYRGAQRAAAVGLTANSCNEQLFRDAITAAHRSGDGGEVHRLVDNLQARIEQIDPDGDLEDETIELLEVLQVA